MSNGDAPEWLQHAEGDLQYARLGRTEPGIPLNLVSGADVHLVPDLLVGLQEGRLLTLGGSRYVLIEPAGVDRVKAIRRLVHARGYEVVYANRQGTLYKAA